MISNHLLYHLFRRNGTRCPYFELLFGANELVVIMRDACGTSGGMNTAVRLFSIRTVLPVRSPISMKWTGSNWRYGSVLFLTAFYKHTRNSNAPKIYATFSVFHRIENEKNSCKNISWIIFFLFLSEWKIDYVCSIRNISNLKRVHIFTNFDRNFCEWSRKFGKTKRSELER